ncbi:MAG: hypothetical protein ABS46_14300 [Cytophagaceae bacterium SCN 52-12]|nr:MAG: hypothetical protein ABS46_14300 [Cytophagaceae bacterium SCN 52-12]
MIHISIDTEDKKLLKAIRALLDLSGASYKETRDDSKMSSQEFYAKIDRSLQEVEEGKVTKVRNKKELHAFLEEL